MAKLGSPRVHTTVTSYYLLISGAKAISFRHTPRSGVSSPVPVLRPLLDRRRAHRSLTPSGCLLLPELKRPLAATCVGTTNSYPYRMDPPPGSDTRTRSSLSYSGLAQTLPAAQSKVALGGQLLEVVPMLGAWSMGCRFGVGRWR